MARLIMSIVLLVILAVIVAFNAGYTTGFNLFGYTFESVPTVSIGLGAFVMGVLYSFLLYMMSYFSKKGRRRIRDREAMLRDKEGTLRELEQDLARQESVDEPGGQAPTKGRGLFGGRGKKR